MATRAVVFSLVILATGWTSAHSVIDHHEAPSSSLFLEMLQGTLEYGAQHDGRWSCPNWITGVSCKDGTFHCTCPGSRKPASFTIGCCYKFPKCGEICDRSASCSKYTNCKQCRKGTLPMGSLDACLSCQPGFRKVSGRCATDINECRDGNGGCEHECINTYGSYYCHCRAGYRLREDQHTCQVMYCDILDTIPNGHVTPTLNWSYESYAHYGCDVTTHVLVGRDYRSCNIQAASTGVKTVWGGKEPTCNDICAIDSDVPLFPCGRSGVTPIQCRELGCCYSSLTQTCNHKQLRSYVYFSGLPKEHKIIKTLSVSTVQGCKYRCDKDAGVQGNAIILPPPKYDNFKEQNVTLASCTIITSNYGVSYSSKYQLQKAIEASPSASAFFYDEQRDIENKVYMGCYERQQKPVSAQFAFSGHPSMNPSKCIEVCRDLRFSFAIIEGGSNCACGAGALGWSNLVPVSDKPCDIPCSGDVTALCGGNDAYSVYLVPSDERYLGCYADETEHKDIPVRKWGAEAGKSVSQCIKGCVGGRHFYAAVEEAGTCYCGRRRDHLRSVQETYCNATCAGGGNCGGTGYIALYRTEHGNDLGESERQSTAGQLFDQHGLINGFDTSVFTLFPGVRKVVFKRLILQSTSLIVAPSESACATEVCYQPCGELHYDELIDSLSGDITLRFFFLKMSQLSGIIGASASRVFIYAQTVVIDVDLDLHHALFIRARQIIINRKTSVQISVKGDVPEFDLDPYEARKYAFPIDTLFAKQSFLCAKILTETRQQYHTNTAWAILRDISNVDDTSCTELKAFALFVKSKLIELSHISQGGVHFVPMYTKSHISKILKTYYDSVSVYKSLYDYISDKTISDAAFLRNSKALHQVYSSTDVAEARTALISIVDTIQTSYSTYKMMKSNFDEARTKLDSARIDFDSGIKNNNNRIKSLAAITQGVFHVVYGLSNEKNSEVLKGAGLIAMELKNIIGLDLEMAELALTVAQIEKMVTVSENILDGLNQGLSEEIDFSKYIIDIEKTASLRVSIVTWQSVKDMIVLMLTDPDVMKIPGSNEYMQAFVELGNWGEALTRSMVEQAELMRQAVEKRSILDARIEKQKTTDQALVAMEKNVTSRHAVLVEMTEQTFDVRLDLIDALLTFCQAYFYENLVDCHDSAKPSFGGDLSSLLLKVSNAMRHNLRTPHVPSTVSRIADIKDSDLDPGCADVTVCPINYFRKNGILIFTLALDHSEFADLQKYRVAEVALDIVGVKPKEDSKILQMSIESSGYFLGRLERNVYTFLTSPLSLTYEYDILSGHVSVRADVYDTFREIIHHITPFTTWVMTLQRCDLDLSDVTEIRVRFDGSGIPSIQHYNIN